MHTQTLLALTLIYTALPVWAQNPADSIQSKHKVIPRQPLSLTIEKAIEQGLRKNFAQQNRDYTEQVLALNWQDTQQGFWMPQFNLELTGAPQRLFRFKKGRYPGNDGSLSGTLALEVEEYTLFNWGKDYLSYLNTRTDFLRDNQNLKDEKRKLRNRIMIQYSRLDQLNSIKRVLKEQLSKSAYIYRFAREKARLGQLSTQDFSAARSQYLRAQSEYQIGLDESRHEDARMAMMIVDPSSTRYILKGTTHYRKLHFPLDKGLEMAKKNNPQIKREQKNVEHFERKYKLTQRENYPLPKISLNVGAYRHHWESSNSLGRYETHGTNSNLDIVAEIKATWPLSGKGGLFNRRKTQGALIKVEQAHSRLTQAQHRAHSQVERHYRTIKSLESQMAVARARRENAIKNFDLTLENYINRKTRFSAFQQALEEMVQAHIHFLNTQYRHFEKKVLLTEAIGIEDFPEEILQNSLKPKKETPSP